jgi:crossover junction endodeoxyribonuclease RusA
VRLTLPFPSPKLNPNAREHWSVVSREKKRLRALWSWDAISQGARRLDAACLHLVIEFCPPPPPSRRDIDNLLASIKAGLDGLADTLGVDDSNWTLELKPMGPLTKGGCVHIDIRVREEQAA